MEILKNASLKDLNTFGVNASTKFYTEIHGLEDIESLLEWRAQNDLPCLLLGGGSNLLFKNDYQGLVAKVCLTGKDVAEENDDFVYVSAAGGENWHDFVRWCVENNYAGLENLSLIPGTVGAAPIQNIGAYGVELADHFHSLQAINLETSEVLEFDKTHCHFAYRESFFKSQALDKLLITSVTFALPKKPEWKMDYAGMLEVLDGKKPTAKLISDAIIKLRQSKLPDPVKIGNAGSFFKNPVMALDKWESLKERYPDLPGYKQTLQPADGFSDMAEGSSDIAEGSSDKAEGFIKTSAMKTSAAWLIDACDWKGFRKGDAGVSELHALVLVNYGKASGVELWEVAQQIIASVEDKFGISLEVEPRLI